VSLVECSLQGRKFVVDRVGLPLGEQRRVVELDQFFLDHPPHQVGGVDVVDAVPELAVETIGIQ